MPEQVDYIKVYFGKQVLYLPIAEYDYSFENGVLTIHVAPYSASEGVITIE